MDVLTKIIECCTAAISWLAKFLTAKYPLWLYIVASLGAALLFGVIGCTHEKYLQRVVVGHVTEDGHDYIFFRDEKNDASLTVLHDPNCMCHFIEDVE